MEDAPQDTGSNLNTLILGYLIQLVNLMMMYLGFQAALVLHLHYLMPHHKEAVEKMHLDDTQ